MKSLLLVLLAILALVCAAPSTSFPTETAAAGIVEPQRKEIVVYVTDTGAKYHRPNCRHLRRSRRAMTLSQAQQAGYDACKVCRPAR